MFIYIAILTGDDEIGETELIKINTSSMETIAALKDKYIQTKRCPTPNYIALKYRGQLLRDEKLLREYNIGNEDTIYHVVSSFPSYSVINYHQLSEGLKDEAKRAGDYKHAGYSNTDNSLWDTDWNKGDEWKEYPPVLVHDTAERNRNEIISSPTLKPTFIPNIYTGRSLIKAYICKVNGFFYKLYHKMEGRWNGTVNIVDSNNHRNNVRICTSFISFNPKGYWEEKQTMTTKEGITTVYELKLRPFSNNVLKIETNDPKYSQCFITLTEESDNIMLITYTSRTTGQPVMIETINYVDDYQRVRIQQHYHKSGELGLVDIYQERRVIDSVSGAVEKFGNFTL